MNGWTFLQGLFFLGSDPRQGYTENLVRMKGLDTATGVAKMVILYDAEVDARRGLNRVNIMSMLALLRSDGWTRHDDGDAHLTFDGYRRFHVVCS